MFRKIFPLLGCLTLGVGALQAPAQTGDDEARVTVTINPDGSKTVYQKDGRSRQATATTTGADGKPRGRIIYQLDSEGRYESGQASPQTALFVSRHSINTTRLDASCRRRSSPKMIPCGTRSFTTTTLWGSQWVMRFMMATASCWDAQPPKSQTPKTHAPAARLASETRSPRPEALSSSAAQTAKDLSTAIRASSEEWVSDCKCETPRRAAPARDDNWGGSTAPLSLFNCAGRERGGSTLGSPSDLRLLVRLVSSPLASEGKESYQVNA